jgi:hypothetical protein
MKRKKKKKKKMLPARFIIQKAHYFINCNSSKLAVAAGYQLFVRKNLSCL